MAPRSEPQPELARAIRRVRAEKGISQEELAHRADIHPTWVSHLESGRNNPSWASVRRICRALDIRVSELAMMAEELEGTKRG